MHRNGATVLHLHCCMNSESVSEPETCLQIDIPFRPPEILWCFPLWNNQAAFR
jgi:hypothetical protein